MIKKVFFILLFFLSFFLSIIYGETYIPPSELINPTGVYSIILENIRLPTVIATALIGSSLAICGAVLQILLRNPLMDPYISGTASGGAFGAVLSYFLLVFNLPFAFLIYISPIIAFVFAMIATLLALAIGKRTGVYGLIIGGVVITFVFSAFVTILVTFISIKYPFMPSVTFWLQGEIIAINWYEDSILFTLTIILVLLGIRDARKEDLVAISDEMAYARGINTNRYRIFWISVVSIISAYIVSIVGIIGLCGNNCATIVRRAIGESTTLINFVEHW
jgi:iron complex transport system permease protein